MGRSPISRCGVWARAVVAHAVAPARNVTKSRRLTRSPRRIRVQVPALKRKSYHAWHWAGRAKVHKSRRLGFREPTWLHVRADAVIE